MISALYWIVTIIISIILQSLGIFTIMIIIWVLWMILRMLAKNGIFTDSSSSWWYFDSLESSSDDILSDFGGGDFGGGGAEGSWGDSDSDGGDGGD